MRFVHGPRRPERPLRATFSILHWPMTPIGIRWFSLPGNSGNNSGCSATATA